MTNKYKVSLEGKEMSKSLDCYTKSQINTHEHFLLSMNIDLQIGVLYRWKIIDEKNFTSICQIRVGKLVVVYQDPWFSVQKI